VSGPRRAPRSPRPHTHGRRILVTGALGQIGAELVPALRERYGAGNVVASDVRMPHPGESAAAEGPFEYVDCQHLRQIETVLRRYDVDTIFHLAALLSATAERSPRVAWDVNMGGVYRVLEAARAHGCAVFHPSSIGAFGPTTPRDRTPQDTVQRPTTMYGVTKVAAELLCDYYAARFGLDTRGVRFPGLVSWTAPPGGGTTDYAVELFRDALRHGRSTCYLRADTTLPFLSMRDAVRAAIELMDADAARLVHRNAFNVASFSASPQDWAAAIRRHVSGFVVDCAVDPVRQAIADSWPRSLDDSAARAEWGWAPRDDLDTVVADMLEHLRPLVPAAAG
jgi:nucleoside-diphosphate-sugar epimerase